MPRAVWLLPIWLLPICLWTACPSADDACQVESDCPAGRYCQAGVCAFDCTYDSQCPPGFRCSERGRCERGCVKTNGGIEACDGLDNDCDGQVDEEFPELSEVCSFGGCPPGLIVCSQDGDGTECDAQQPADDDATCDGVDDDCDGQTDEDVIAQPCELQSGVCSGAMSTCQLGEWSPCDYGQHYQPAPDASCDQRDNDCDGATDEDAAPLPQPELNHQSNDGLDNNCNGVVDEPGGLMIAIDSEFAIDLYESSLFADPDCSGFQHGVAGDDYPVGFPAQGQRSSTLYACSLPGVHPSGWLSWYRASWACQAQGKRLCTAAEWRTACMGPDNTAFPYGQYMAAPICNIGWDAPAPVAMTGAYDACTNGMGCFDMSGNQTEWLVDEGRFGPTSALVGGGSHACIICADGYSCRPCVRQGDADLELIKRQNNCEPDIGRDYESFERHMAYTYLGGRCCLDLP
jgi:hypothetical protein